MDRGVLKTRDKLGCVFPMVISSDFRMGEHRDDDHEEDAPYFMTRKADVIDDATKQMTLIAFFRMFFRVPPTQMSTYDQKFGMKMIARTWRIF